MEKNKTLIGPDQWNYQRELERNYQQLTDQLAPMLIANISPNLPISCNNSLNTPENYGFYDNCSCNISTINTCNNENFGHPTNYNTTINIGSDILQ